MSPENMAAKASPKDDNQSSGGSRKSTSARPNEQALKCPRCDSQNTKFCYYNNYSLTQPRHFCKTCRRYWTKGGALRNVPIGGGCRKNKKMKSSSSRLSGDNSKDSNSSSSDIGHGLKFFHGLSPPAMDFNLGGLNFPRIHNYNQFSSFGDISSSTSGPVAVPSTPCFGLDHPLTAGGNSNPLIGFNFPFPSPLLKPQEMGSSVNAHTSLASSIESLSSINQDLHWKLQQQRLAMLFGGENNHKESSVVQQQPFSLENQIQKPLPILFQSLGTSKSEAINGVDNARKEPNLATEWFFDNSYAPVTPTPTHSTSNGNDQNGNSWEGIQAWNNLNQYSALP